MMLAEVRRLRPSRTVVRAIRVVVSLLVIGVLVVEGVALAGHAGALADALAHANLGLVALALALEVASWLAFVALHRRMLSSGGLRVPLPKIASVLLVANALSATLPVGSAVATGYNFTRFRRFGASVPLAAWVLVISGLISTAVLGAGTRRGLRRRIEPDEFGGRDHRGRGHADRRRWVVCREPAAGGSRPARAEGRPRCKPN